MAIKIIMGIYLLILLITSLYLWHCQDKQFLIYNSKSTANFKTIMRWTSILLMIEIILGIFLLLQRSRYLNLVTLIISSLTVLIFSLLINQKNE
ncbi:hypothetical protein PT281_02415 [Lactobacillus sp. ESL0701]|uniref:hypothetical protein n=1 Tax=Lactobacillus sp. ESL0701 TaxID=2983217 RepID=UPI0023F8C5D6|nr:hypothetical protein [Lactobacillus sp. ESL0701]MDF7672143.1 hypothetical protein [Lactobacillus sp. ESL0701]